MHDLERHPKLGASWEGLVIEQIGQIKDPQPMYHWSAQRGAEMDVFIQVGGRNYGLEIKRSSAPSVTRSMRTARDDLDLEHVGIIYPGHVAARLDEHVSLVPLTHLPSATNPAELVAQLTAT